MDNNNAPCTGIDDPVELDRFLTAYRPSDVAKEVWLLVAAEAAALVRVAGELTRLRVEKDIQALGAVVSHLVERGRPVTLEEALSDATLLSYDGTLRAGGAKDRTRENKRGILRRLQAAHRGLPWRAPRRADGERVTGMVHHATVGDVGRVLEAARGAAGDPEATAFIDAVNLARADRARTGPGPGRSADQWDLARRFADRHGLHLTKPILRSVATHEVLVESTPVAIIVARYALTRRDLDLALTRVADMPVVPLPADHALLRGTTN